MIGASPAMAGPSIGAVRDLTDAAENARVLDRAAELLLGQGADVFGADERATSAGAVAAADPVELEALRCARSRLVLEEALSGAGFASDGPRARLTIVWAMYGETGRIRPSGPDNPHGEDFLQAKVAQVSWLTDGLPIDWNLIAVDDGCPDEPSSAAMAETIAAEQGWDRPVSPGRPAPVRVLRLADAIGDEPSARPELLGPAFDRLATTADSRKGGSILLGLADAVAATAQTATTKPATAASDPACHVVLYTDADLSANVAQAGLLAGPIIDGRAGGVVGQRYGVDGAVLVKEQGASAEPISTGSKPDKMIILFRHFVRATLIPDLASVMDTQAGFKAFESEALLPVLGEMASFDETFDVELLIRFAQRTAGLAVAPIVFVEDFAQTNFPSVDPGARHLDMVKQLIGVYDTLVASIRPVAGEAADILDRCRSLDLNGYVELIERLRADDERRAVAGGPDPLFDSRWTAADLAD